MLFQSHVLIISSIYQPDITDMIPRIAEHAAWCMVNLLAFAVIPCLSGGLPCLVVVKLSKCYWQDSDPAEYWLLVRLRLGLWYIVHDDVIKWKHFPRYWPYVWGIHRSPVNSLHKGQLRGALMFSFFCARTNGWVNNREAGDLRRYRGHYDVTVMNWSIYQAYLSNTSSHF